MDQSVPKINFKTIFLSRESLLIAIIFICFCAFKTQFYNLIYLILDATVYQGNVTKNFQLNYKGTLAGCFRVAKFMEFMEGKSYFVKNIHWIVPWTISLAASSIFILRKKSFPNFYIKWIIFLFASFGIYYALGNTISIIKNYNPEFLIDLLTYIPFLLLGAYIFFQCLNKREKIQIIFIAAPAYIIGANLWWNYIGPAILPFVI